MQLGWIDFSKADREKALDVIRLFCKSEAVDELGIGIIRDAFSNFLFPEHPLLRKGQNISLSCRIF